MQDCVHEGIADANYRIRAYECDSSGRLSPKTLCNLLQDTAWVGANRLNLDLQETSNADRSWVLLGLRLEVGHFPSWRDEVTIRTWPSGLRRIYAFRDFEMLDAVGNRWGRATSQWLVFDLKTRRPLRIPSGIEQHIAQRERAIDFDFEGKLPPNKEYDASMCFPVRSADVDLNGHVNNARYVQWALEPVLDARANAVLSALDIRFFAESFLGDEVVSESAFVDEWATRHRISRVKDGKTLAEALVHWR